MADKDMGKELDWNAEIDADAGEFTLLPAGEYGFYVESFERARYNGSAKMSACWSAKLKLTVGDDEQRTTITHNLYLHTKCAGLLASFFRSIGQRQHGDKIAMDWNKVPGSNGRCKVGIRQYKSKQGEDREANEVKAFIDPPADQASTTEQDF